MPYTICCDNPFYRGHDLDHDFQRVDYQAQTQVADEATARALVDAHDHLHCPDLADIPDGKKEADASTDAGDGDAGDAQTGDAFASLEDGEPAQDASAWEVETDLTDIDGIGDATADALHEEGITSVQALAAVDDVVALAEQISGVSKGVLAGFKGRAQAMIEDTTQDAQADADA